MFIGRLIARLEDRRLALHREVQRYDTQQHRKVIELALRIVPSRSMTFLFAL